MVASLVGLAGCNATGAPDKTVPGWIEPGWMAQVRQENEEYQDATVACYAEYGIKGTKAMAGVVTVSDLSDDSGQLPPGTQGVLDAMAKDCNARVKLPEHSIDKTLDEAAYGRMLDTRACMVAQGYDVPEPPSFETWKDSGLQWAWNPYSAVFAGQSGAAATDAELQALDKTCPQSGPNFVVFS